MVGKDRLAGPAGLFLAHCAKAPGREGLGLALDDEGGGILVELVGMRPDPAVLGLDENELERIKQLVSPQPDELVRAHVDIDLEGLLARGADAAVEPVAGDDQIELAVSLQRRIDLDLDMLDNPELGGAVLQDVEQALAADANETVPGRGHLGVVHMNVDVVPVGELGFHHRGTDRVVGAQVGHRLVREHYPPAEGVARLVALEQLDLHLGFAQLHRDREIEPRGSAADTGNLHRSVSFV